MADISLSLIGTQELRHRLDQPSTVPIDVRDINAYNGWRLLGEARGGHLPRARSLPFSWVGKDFWSDALDKKRISEDSDLVVYGYSRTDSESVAGAVSAAAFRSVRLYDGFLDEWSASDDLPMERMPRFHRLAHPRWLKDLLEGKAVEGPPAARHVICHSHYRNPGDYDQGRIPESIPLNTLDLEEPDRCSRPRNCRPPATGNS